MKYFSILLVFLGLHVHADVVKPTLVEITFFDTKSIEVSLDLSIEAAISGIGTQFKNTKDSPNSSQYDELRALEPEDLKKRFLEFEELFLKRINLQINGKLVSLNLIKSKIDIIGYKKRPRKSILTYSAQLKYWPNTMSWSYDKIYGDSALRYRFFKIDEYTWNDWAWLRNGTPSGLINLDHPQVLTTKERITQFIGIGFDHVIPLGWDHILFIVGMALSSLIFKNLFILVTTFTLAHTLTLGLAMYGVIEVSSRIVEPLIAFSIAYVAIENLITNQSLKRKSIIVFFFGLIHGLGFATMLKEFSMTRDNFLTTLISFNVGVEIAQILIVSLVVCLLLLLRFSKIDYKLYMVNPASIIIAIIGMWWGIERVFG